MTSEAVTRARVPNFSPCIIVKCVLGEPGSEPRTHVEGNETIRIISARLASASERNAMKRRETADLRPEYAFDYSKAVRGKYYKRLRKEGIKPRSRRARRTVRSDG